MGATETLSRLVTETETEHLPAWTFQEATRCFINYVGVSLGASQEEGVDLLVNWATQEGGAPKGTVIGRDLRTSLGNAAMLNGYMAHLLDFDDTHLPTILHPSAPVWPAAQAIAEDRLNSGKETLAAFVLGVEVESRLSLSVHPWHYDQGWHITGTAGVFGATAAAGRLLGLTAEQMAQAFGIAGTQASGVREILGSMTKAMHPAKAASVGVQAALLAEMGFTGNDTMIEGRRGFWAVLSSPGHDESAIEIGLGERWELANNGLKPYANGVVIHPLQDAAISFRNDHNIKPEQVASITIRVHPLVLELTNRPNPRHGYDGKFSYQYCVAAALVDGAGFPFQFSDERFNDPAIVSLVPRVSATVDPSVREDETFMTLTLIDGQVLEKHIAHATGSPTNPLSNEFLEHKFRSLAQSCLSARQADAFLQEAWGLDEAPDISNISSLMVPHP